MRALPTAPLAAGSLIVSYAVVAASGSRPLGGAVLAAGGLCCIGVWTRRHGRRTAAQLAGVGFAAFVASHLLALALGPWPAVLIVAAVAGAATWELADKRTLAPTSTVTSAPAATPAPTATPARKLAFRPPAR
ncbi:MAG TPA: hypothetical protein VK721_05450 [Solirubrobacteraceae bacterium]|nr:hypothetical protein [Solirubrobacteraceae bacterium]